MSDAIATLADTAIRDALHSRAEPRRAARVIMITVQGACRDCGVDAHETISLIARTMVSAISQLGGNVAATTMGLIHGAIDSAASAGIPAETAAAAAADGALQAAGDEGDEGWCVAASVHQALAHFVTSRWPNGRQPATKALPAASPRRVP